MLQLLHTLSFCQSHSPHTSHIFSRFLQKNFLKIIFSNFSKNSFLEIFISQSDVFCKLWTKFLSSSFKIDRKVFSFWRKNFVDYTKNLFYPASPRKKEFCFFWKTSNVLFVNEWISTNVEKRWTLKRWDKTSIHLSHNSQCFPKSFNYIRKDLRFSAKIIFFARGGQIFSHQSFSNQQKEFFSLFN